MLSVLTEVAVGRERPTLDSRPRNTVWTALLVPTLERKMRLAGPGRKSRRDTGQDRSHHPFTVWGCIIPPTSPSTELCESQLVLA